MSGHAMMTKAISDVEIEVGAFGGGGEQILKHSTRSVEVAVNGSRAKLQFERLIGAVSRCLEHGGIQSSIKGLGVSVEVRVRVNHAIFSQPILDPTNGLP